MIQYGPGAYGPGSYGPGPYGPGAYGPGSYGPGPYGPGAYGPGPQVEAKMSEKRKIFLRYNLNIFVVESIPYYPFFQDALSLNGKHVYCIYCCE